MGKDTGKIRNSAVRKIDRERVKFIVLLYEFVRTRVALFDFLSQQVVVRQ